MIRSLLLALVGWLAVAAPAEAHKMRLFATAEGAVVSGYGYFSGGDRAQDVVVTAEAGGAVVHSGVTAEDGTFSFIATLRADHLIRLDAGDGHAASFTLRAAELPESLPTPEPRTGGETPAPVKAAAPPAAPPALDDARLAELVERAVARQVRPLREQLDAYEQTTRWRDAAGGIGFIVGLAGLAYGLASRKREEKRQ